MAGRTKQLLVEKLSPHYERYAEWLSEEHELNVPADHLQVALRHYAAYQKSDFNKAAKAEERAEREAAKAFETKTATKRRGRKAADEDEDEDEDEEEAAPPAKTTARKATPAKRAGRGSKASF